MRTQLARFHRRSARSSSCRPLPFQRRGEVATRRAPGRTRRRRERGRAGVGSATMADDSDRDAHANAISAVAQARVGVELLGDRAGAARRADRRRWPRCGGRPTARSPRRPAAERSRAPALGMPAVSRILSGCPGSVSRPPSSTSSSAISTATPLASSRPTTGPTPRAATSSRSPSWRSPATRPKTSCCARRSSRRRGEALEQARGAHRHAPRWSSASPKRGATSSTRPRSARTGACRASTASTCCRTTRCSTSSATSRRRRSTARCS